MAKNNNKLKFDIPIPIILLAYVVYWPVGIVLTVLRSISVPSNKSADHTNTYGSRENDSKSKKNPKSKRKASLGFVLSMLGGVLASCPALAETINWAFDFGYLVEYALPWIIIAAACFISAKLFKNRDVRLNRIRTIIGNRSSINLTKLAAACDESLKKIRRDVQKLIDNGEYGDDAYIDLGSNNFMRSSFAEPDEPEAFDYKTVYGNLFKEEKNSEKKAEAKNVKEQSAAEDLSGENDDFGRIIREIRRLNDDIKDVAVSYRIEQIEEHTKNIFEYVTDHPEAMPQIRTFMNYYLPTTLKLLESYSRIERVGVAGENMKKSKDNIENTLDLLVVGFERQVDLLFKNESIDISSDISVLETMMKKDGLSSNKDFDIKAYEAQYTDEISDDLSAGGAAAQEKPNI